VKEALEREPQLILKALLDSETDAIVCTDLEGTILSWNRGAEGIFGYTAEEAIGQHGSFVFLDGQYEEFSDRRARERLERGERLDPYVAKRRRKDGRVVYLEITVSPVVRDGRTVGLVGLGRDVTARRESEEELRRSNEELEQFAYAASHDLSEPLRVIAGFVELLASRYGSQLDAEAHRFIRYTVDGVERMQAVIDDLLAYSRAGRVELVKEPVDSRRLADEVVQALGEAIAKTGAEVKLGELPTVCAEPTLLRQVLQNLIGNAIKFANGNRPLVEVEAQRQGRWWRFEVTDNGPGIDPDHRERIFQMFRRLHGREVPGTGIGLALAKRIVERHGGRIWCEGVEGRSGTRFCFTLPALGEPRPL